MICILGKIGLPGCLYAISWNMDGLNFGTGRRSAIPLRIEIRTGSLRLSLSLGPQLFAHCSAHATTESNRPNIIAMRPTKHHSDNIHPG